MPSVESHHLENQSYKIEKNIFSHQIEYDDNYFNLFLCSLLKPNALELILQNLKIYHLKKEQKLDLMLSAAWLKNTEIFKILIFEDYNLIKENVIYEELEKIKYYHHPAYLACHIYMKIIKEEIAIQQILFLKNGLLNYSEDFNDYKKHHDDKCAKDRKI